MQRLLLLAVVLALAAAAAQGSSGATHLRNGVIAYAYHGALSNRWQIYTITATGAHRHRLTTSRRFSSFEPSYSPYGKQIVFVRRSQRRSFFRSVAQADLWTMNADGTRERRLTWTKTIDEFNPAWSPDGKWIAFAAADRSQSEQPEGIWVVGIDGHGLRQLAPGFVVAPTWSPDGSEIAFSGRDAATQKGGIFVMSAEGGAATELTEAPDYEPAWSPNGSQILFSSTRGSELPEGDQEADIWVMNSDGSGAAPVRGITSVNERNPAWSPDGRRIVQVTRSDVHFGQDLQVIRADGTGAHWVSHSCSDCESVEPSWQPLPG